ncbi:hypothetical protein SFC76_06610 [Sphingomonas sp. CD22]|uniref:hypothetical protein n=1 Tax=Sphingomonas sp. CD22 TaxID=3100214 RepID=UPI002ADF715E|nr:hypothetical protein [Sphingomonas sp. CD22]MEA1083929.1 hypothetical protein [Sphingomonas sp. CD22]
MNVDLAQAAAIPPVCDTDVATSPRIGNDLGRAALAAESKETIMAGPYSLPLAPVPQPVSR